MFKVLTMIEIAKMSRKDKDNYFSRYQLHLREKSKKEKELKEEQQRNDALMLIKKEKEMAS